MIKNNENIGEEELADYFERFNTKLDIKDPLLEEDISLVDFQNLIYHIFMGIKNE